MRNFKSIFAAAILFLTGVTAANAQIADGGRISVSVPNEFVLRDKTFPAGTYTITRTPATTDSGSLLLIRGENSAMVFDTMKSETAVPAGATQLVFDNVDGVSYLSGIAVQGTTARNEILKTKRQKQAFSAGTASQTYVTVANTGF